MLELVLCEGEGFKVEFKERLSSLDREMVAFANTSGGTIYLGVNDAGSIIGIPITNALKSQVTDIAYNIDPSIKVTLQEFTQERVLAIHVPSGMDKPYRCKDGFFLRNGPSTQKLKRDDIIELINQAHTQRFDEMLNHQFRFPEDFSQEALDEYLRLCGIKTRVSAYDILLSLNVAEEEHQGNLICTNAGVLFFAKDPQKFFPESYITAVSYKTEDRFSLYDKKDFKGSPINQIDNSLSFMFRHMTSEPRITGISGARHDVYEYSPIALREAIINAVVHRDYLYDSSHIYIHMFPQYIEIESPGGLYRGLSLEDLGKRSIRRNRLIADLLHRAGFIERVGSGFSRMQHALAENNNPPLEVVATNFFNIRFRKRLQNIDHSTLTSRQITIYQTLCNVRSMSKKELAQRLTLGEDTTLRELTYLIKRGLIKKQGTGRAIRYTCVDGEN